MFPRIMFISMLAIVLFGCASNGDEKQAGAATGDTVSAEAEKPKMRCRREPNTGFRLGNGRVCEPVVE